MRDQRNGCAAHRLLIGVWATLLIVGGAAAESPREKLTAAEDHFLSADFRRALDETTRLIESGELKGSVLRDAHVLRARCEVAMAHRSSSIDAFCEALRVDPAWQPDPDFFTAGELEAFDQAAADCGPKEGTAPSYLPERQSTSSSPWYRGKFFLGAVGTAAVAATVLALSGGDEGAVEADLPLFPPPPDR